MAFKMKGSPMARNYGIGAPTKKTGIWDTIKEAGSNLAGDVSAIASGVGNVVTGGTGEKGDVSHSNRAGDTQFNALYTEGKNKKEVEQAIAAWEKGGKKGPKPTYKAGKGSGKKNN
jgi:D-alanyl-D-alanine carboxypeptidase